MVVIKTYNPYEIDMPMSLNEGNVTVYDDVEADFGKDSVAILEKPFKKGDYVALDEKDFTVKKAEEGDTIIGQLIDEPAWNGDRPTETTTYGEYEARMGTIRMNCDYVHAVKLVDENTAVAVGDSVEYKGDNEFDKAASGDGTNMALQTAEALSGAKITVMYGLRPM